MNQASLDLPASQLNKLEYGILKLLNDDEGSYFSDLSKEEKAVAVELCMQANPDLIESLWKINHRFKPASISNFISPYYIGETNSKYIYPIWRERLEHIFNPQSQVQELILSGAIGTGKTTTALVSLAYLLHIITSLRDPHDYYQMPSFSPIVLAMFSISLTKAEQVLTGPVGHILRTSSHFEQVKKSELFEDYMRNNPDKVPYTIRDNSVYFPNNLQIAHGSTELHSLSLNIIGGFLDETEFRKEARKADQEFSEAFSLYLAVKERTRSRFLGKSGYLTILASSKRFKDSPTEVHIKDAKKDPYSIVYEDSIWSTKNQNLYSGKKFRLFIGNRSINPRILRDEEVLTSEEASTTEGQVIEVPVEYFSDFDKDVYRAIRDLAGISTNAISPFFPNTSVLDKMFDEKIKNVELLNINTRFDDDKCLNYLMTPLLVRTLDGKYVLKRSQNEPRYLRADLSGGLENANDSTGLAMLHKELNDFGDTLFVYDFAFDIDPGKGGINLNAILEFIRYLKEDLGIQFRGVSSDSYQSIQLLQFCKNKLGIDNTKVLSVDRTIDPYLLFKNAILSEKLKVGYRERIKNECIGLEDLGNKIDHKAKGSKDIADAMAGSYFMAASDTDYSSSSFYGQQDKPKVIGSVIPQGKEKNYDDLFVEKFMRGS